MSDADQPNLYEVLGVAPDASQRNLTRAYRRRARELHPDLAVDADHDAFADLAHAYRVLSDPARRAFYDTSLQEPSGPALRRSTRIAVQIRHIGRPAPPRSGPRRSPIVAGPTFVVPNDPEAGQ